MATNMTFVDFATPVPADWLNNVNTIVNTNVVNVKTFGAKGDGVTDDTAAVQAAINAVCPFLWQGSTRQTEHNAISGAVYFPAGTYICSSKIRLAPGLRLFGDNATSDFMSDSNVAGAGTNIKRFGSCLFSTYANQTSYAFDTSPWLANGTRADDRLQAGGDSTNGVATQVQGIVIENMTLAGNWTSRGLNLAGADTCRLHNVFIKGFNVGIRCSAVWYGNFTDVRIESNYRGFIAYISCTDIVMHNFSTHNTVEGITYNPATQGREASDPVTTTDLTQSMIDLNTGIVNYYSNIVGTNVAVENLPQAFLSSNAVDSYRGIYVEGITDTILRIANFDQQNGYYHFDTINPCAGNLLWSSQARVEVDCAWNNYTQANFNKLISFVNAPGNNRDLIPVFNEKFKLNVNDTYNPVSFRYQTKDYNYGTWTPVLTFGGSSASSSQTNFGFWHRVGNRVVIDFNILIGTKSGATGQAIISGLPFNIDTTAQRLCVGSMGLLSNATATMVPLMSWNSGATFYLLRAVGTTNATDVDFSNSAQITGTISYEIAPGD